MRPTTTAAALDHLPAGAEDHRAGSISVHRIMRGSRALGYVAIDSTIAGRARGGLRMVDDLCEEEVRAGSRTMTLKYGLLGLPQGGAKAGVAASGDAPASEKRRALEEFARAAGSLVRDRRYVPDADMGTSAADIRWMMKAVGARVAPREWKENRSGLYTAQSCVAAALAVLERRGAPLEGCRVAIEGFGSVGAPLAALLRSRGARVVAISTSCGALYRPDGLDVDRLFRRAAEVGSRFVEDEPEAIERAALLGLEVDVLFPCARFHSIHAGNVEGVAAQAICAGANDPISPDAAKALLHGGVCLPPDFVTNCGGVLGGTLEFAGVPPARIGVLIEQQLRRRVADLLDQAERIGVPPRELAELEALERHARVRRDAERRSVSKPLRSLALEAYRRRLIPRWPVSLVARRYVVHGMGR